MCYSACPYADPANKNQEKLTHISAEELRTEMKYPPLTWPKKLFQLACFFIFLGPLRFIIAIIDLIVCAVVIVSIRGIVSLLGYDPDIARPFNYWFGKKCARLLGFCFGVVWIHVDGKIESDTRIVTSNHVSLLDPLIILCYKNLSCTAKKEFSSVPLVKDCIGVTNPIYIDRSKKCGATEQIREHAANMKNYPVLIFPEGTIAKGDIMLKFHRGAFITPYKTQGICMRYVMPFVPKRWNTYVWAGQSALSMVFSLVSMPPSICTLKILKQTDLAGFGNGDPEVFATKQQLLMANELGVKAVDGSSNLLFKKDK